MIYSTGFQSFTIECDIYELLNFWPLIIQLNREDKTKIHTLLRFYLINYINKCHTETQNKHTETKNILLNFLFKQVYLIRKNSVSSGSWKLILISHFENVSLLKKIFQCCTIVIENGWTV